MNNDLLIKIGLTEGEAIIYQYLLENGECIAGKIIKNTPLKRGVVYNILKSLTEKELVSQVVKNKILHFRLEHPLKLQDYIKKRNKEISQIQKGLEDILPALASQYMLVHHRPVVHYFEGLEGIQKVLEDSLTSKTEILSYADIEAINKYASKINEEYAKKRDRLQVKKRGILLDTPFAREFLKNYHIAVTETRFIKTESSPFHTVMQIYDNKISYLTLCEHSLIGVIIENHDIYEMHRYLFDSLWQNAIEIK